MTTSRLHRLGTMNLKSLRGLDRDKTVVLWPLGMIEVHGDHLPLGTDNFGVEALTLAASAWLLENNPSLHVLLLPSLAFGTDPIDKRRPDLFAQAGSVWLSFETLKAVMRDVLAHVIRFGFRWIFPVNFHGGAEQAIAVAEICEALRESHPDLVIYEPTGYVMAGAALDATPGLATLLGRPLTVEEEVALRGSIHASMFETSMMLHLYSELVDPIHKKLRTIEWNGVYQMDDWPGYVGAGPAHANPDVGAAVIRWRGVRAATLIERAMNGEKLEELPRHPVWVADELEGMDISEALQRELPPRETEVDSNPEMTFSKHEVKAEIERIERDEATTQPSLKDITPPSALFETRPNLPTSSEVLSSQDEDEK